MSEEERPLARALALARQRLLLLQAEAVEELEDVDRALLGACEAARKELVPGDGPVIDELLAIQRAAGLLLAEQMEATGARIRQLRTGRSGHAAYRDVERAAYLAEERGAIGG